MTYTEFLNTLSQPAQRALANAGITSFEILAQKTDKDLLSLHGLGPSSIPKIHQALDLNGYKKRR